MLGMSCDLYSAANSPGIGSSPLGVEGSSLILLLFLFLESPRLPAVKVIGSISTPWPMDMSL